MMQLRLNRLQMLVIAGLLGGNVTLSASAAKLTSPWDKHPVEVTEQKYVCPTMPDLSKDIVASSFYSDSKHSITDPTKKAAYDAAREPFSQTTTEVEKAADAFRKTGSRQAAACVIRILVTEADAGAMTGKMSSNQAQYVRNWTLGGFAISWLKVRQAQTATPEQDAVLSAWMQTLAKGVENYFEPRRGEGKTDAQNNHLYWAGFAVMSAGIASNDATLYGWGVGTYKDGVNRIADDGTLPLEMARGQRALHYHLFALAPLVTMAELAQSNGDDLYAFDHNKIHLLVVRALSGLVDNSYFTKKAGVKQDTPDAEGPKSNDVEWAIPFEQRFPDPIIANLIKRAGVKPYGYLGGLPLSW